MMLSKTTRFARSVSLAAMLALIAVVAATPSAIAEESLPPAEKVLDKFVKASGGQAAFDKFENRVVKGSFSMPAMGISAPLTVYSAKPNKSYTLIESEALGKIEQGTDGEVVWEISTMAGPAIKEGDERAELLKMSTFDRVINWRDNFQNVETIGTDEVDGQPCFKVKQTPTIGNDEIYCYDAVTYLPVKIEMTMMTQMGEIPMVMLPTDYRKVDGVQIAFKATIQVMQQERIITTESIDHNVDLSADRFALPAQIAAMVTTTE